MGVSDDEELFPREDAAEEVVAGGEFTPEFFRRVESRVDHAAESRLRRLKGLHQVGERNVADDEEVDVAGVALLAAGEGAEDEGNAEQTAEGLQRAVKAEAEWGNFLDDLRDGPSFWDRLTGKG